MLPYDIMFKDGDLQNIHQMKAQICPLLQIYSTEKGILYFLWKFTGLAKNAKREILRRKGDSRCKIAIAYNP